MASLTEARAAFAPARVPVTIRGVELDVVEPSFALRTSLASQSGLAADIPLVAGTLVLRGTMEHVFDSPSAVLAAGGTAVDELVKVVRETCERWKPAAPAPKKTSVDTTPMEVPPVPSGLDIQ